MTTILVGREFDLGKVDEKMKCQCVVGLALGPRRRGSHTLRLQHRTPNGPSRMVPGGHGWNLPKRYSVAKSVVATDGWSTGLLPA